MRVNSRYKRYKYGFPLTRLGNTVDFLADSKLSEAQAELKKVMSDLSGKSDEEITKVTNLIKAFQF